MAAVALALVACGGGGGDDIGSGGTGNLRVALTDAPACGYDAVNVTIEKVRVHRSATASDSDAGWSELTLSPPKRVDLLTLQNGVLSELGQMPLEAGTYQQLRLVLADNGAGNTLANSVKPTGAAERALDTPSAQQSGLKMNVDMEVKANQLLDLVLDFDACKSVVRAGNSGRYNLKPVVSVIPRFISGVSGALAAGWPAGTTQVSLQQGGVVVRATSPDSTGAFLLQPVSPGTYDLVIAAPGQTTVVVTGVVVAADTVTALNTGATAIAPTASATGTANGKVTTGVTPIDASTRALQTLTMGHTIELAAGPVDATTGDYGTTLAVAAPRVAPFVAAPGTLTFTADTAVAGKYSVQAASGAATKTVGPFTLTSGSTSTNNITFP
jgi:hypothetical protein